MTALLIIIEVTLAIILFCNFLLVGLANKILEKNNTSLIDFIKFLETFNDKKK